MRRAASTAEAPRDEGRDPIRVLLVEDSPDDAELLARVLQRNQLRFVLGRVETARGLLAALESRQWDVVVSDYALPGFSGLEALRLVRERAPRMPFIVVSGTVGEDLAVRTLLDGADDYLLKDRLARLPLAIEQAIHRRSLETAYESASVHLEEKDLLSRAVLASLPALLAVVDHEGTIVAVNEVWMAREDEVPTAPDVGTNLIGVLAETRDDLAPRGAFLANGIEEVLRGRRPEFQSELRWVDGEDSERWTRLSVVPLRTRSGGAVVSQEDITAQVHARERSVLAAAAFASMGEAVVVLDDELVPLEWNDAFVRIAGEAASHPDGGVLGIVRDAMHPAHLEQTLLECACKRRTWSGQFGFRSSDDRLVIARATLAPIVGQPFAPPRSVLVLDDVTELRAAQARLEYIAFHDELTGLPNRTAFRQRVDEAIQRLDGGRVWMLLADINLLKLVNEHLGYEIGDRLLQCVARRFRSVAEPYGPVSRISGDEFGLLLEPGEEMETVAQKLVDAFREPLDVDGHTLSAMVSVGAACCPADGNDFEDLHRCADVALQGAKRNQQVQFAAFDRSMLATVERNLWTSVELPKALREGSLYLDYQPVMQLADRSCAVVEALARWRHPERGNVGPGEFVSAADEIGLTRELGSYVLDLAVRQLAEWRRSGRTALRIATNVSSPLLLDPGFLAELDEILERYGIPPDQLQLEITEGTLMADLEQASSTLRQLRSRGIRVAIDDFGTGYSSLAYLRDLPAHSLKIAKPFVDRLPGSAEDRRVVEAIVHLGRALGLRTVAEGVEREEQLRAIVELGGDEVQGYLIARPMSPAKLEVWIAEHEAGRAGGDDAA